MNLDHRILVEQWIKLLGQIAANQIDLIDARSDHRIEQGVDDAHAVDPHQGLGGVQGDGN